MNHRECKEVLDKLLDYLMARVKTRMLLFGETFEQAQQAVMDEIKSDDAERPIEVRE